MTDLLKLLDAIATGNGGSIERNGQKFVLVTHDDWQKLMAARGTNADILARYAAADRVVAHVTAQAVADADARALGKPPRTTLHRAMPPIVVKTVGDLAALLATLPQDMPLYKRGTMGDWVQNVTVRVKPLAKHTNTDENYTADLTDPVWRSDKAKGHGSMWHPEFLACTIGG